MSVSFVENQHFAMIESQVNVDRSVLMTCVLLTTGVPISFFYFYKTAYASKVKTLKVN